MKKTIILSLLVCSLCTTASAQKDNPMLNNGLSFLNTPYIANTLEKTDNEELFTDRSQVDCTTFVEYVLALSLASSRNTGTASDADFAKYLQKIRYRNGEITGYTSRLHYTTDWVNDNIRKGILEDITALYCEDKDTVRLSYMSTHPEKYKHLKNSPENITRMAEYEKELTGQEIRWLPTHKLPAEGLPWILDGDIILFTTHIPGLDITHMGIALYQKGELHLLHASSKERKVVIDTLPLNKQLANSKSVTGIRVVRMKR